MDGLNRLFRPRHVAVIGGDWASTVIQNLRRMDYSGSIWPVNPGRRLIHGITCLNGLAELPRPPDICFVGINRQSTVPVLAELRDLGCGGAVCFASGYAEADDEVPDSAGLQNRLLEAAGTMPIIGPNCHGYINYLDGIPIWPDQHGGRQVDCGVAIIGQSSNILINLTMQSRSLPIAFIASAGNQARLSVFEIGKFLLEDERITALGIHVEGVKHPLKLVELALRARELGKSVVLLKVGRSVAARSLMVSHTASIAGDDVASAALFERLGIVRVESLEVLLETLKILHMGGPLQGRSICSLSCSGGEAALIADAAEGYGFSFPALTRRQRASLRATLGPLVHLDNPLDYHTYIWGNEEAICRVFVAMMEGPVDCGVLVIDFPRADRCNDSSWEAAISALDRARQQTGTRAIAVSTLPETMPEVWAERVARRAIIPIGGLETALAAMDAAIRTSELSRPDCLPPRFGRRRSDLPPQRLGDLRARSELMAVGVRFPRFAAAASPEEARVLAHEFGGSVAVKALGLDHKTEANAVALDLRDGESVLAAAAAMKAPSGLLVEEFCTDASVEVLIGVHKTPDLSLLLTVGAGGILAELFRDTTSMLLPANRVRIHQSLKSLKL